MALQGALYPSLLTRCARGASVAAGPARPAVIAGLESSGRIQFFVAVIVPDVVTEGVADGFRTSQNFIIVVTLLERMLTCERRSCHRMDKLRQKVEDGWRGVV